MNYPQRENTQGATHSNWARARSFNDLEDYFGPFLYHVVKRRKLFYYFISPITSYSQCYSPKSRFTNFHKLLIHMYMYISLYKTLIPLLGEIQNSPRVKNNLYFLRVRVIYTYSCINKLKWCDIDMVSHILFCIFIIFSDFNKCLAIYISVTIALNNCIPIIRNYIIKNVIVKGLLVFQVA